MGECKAENYTNNDVVLHGPLVCFGGYNCKPCKYLEECMREYGREKRIMHRKGKEYISFRKITAV